jgi:aspartyl-tRNA(Asn)/glutamyl-tRNA(Gln) amidotransferase subunit A
MSKNLDSNPQRTMEKIDELSRLSGDIGTFKNIYGFMSKLDEVKIDPNIPEFHLDSFVVKKSIKLSELRFPEAKTTPLDRILLDKNHVIAKDGEVQGMFQAGRTVRERNITARKLNPIDMPEIKYTLPKKLAKLTIREMRRMLKDGSLDHNYLIEQLKKQTEATKPLGFLAEMDLDFPKNTLPISLKNLYWEKGKVANNSSLSLENFMAPEDATVVKRLKENGFHMFQRTHNDDFACGAYGNKSAFANVLSPYRVGSNHLVAGGSSSGCAVSVALGTVCASLGTDTGGSVRVPAHFCGIVGFKPSVKTISRYGMMELNGEIDTVGIMARHVEDAEILFDVLAGTDPKDMTLRIPEEPVLKTKNLGILGRDVFEDLGISGELDRLLTYLASEDYSYEPVEIAYLDYVIIAYIILTSVNLASVTTRYNGIMYPTEDNFKDKITDYRDHSLGPEVKKRIRLGKYLTRIDNNEYIRRARQMSHMLYGEFSRVFGSHGFIITPLGGTAPDYKNSSQGNPQDEYLYDIFTCPANLLGFCAIVVPVGLRKGRPFGFQILAPYGADRQLFKFAKKVEKFFDFRGKNDFFCAS